MEFAAMVRSVLKLSAGIQLALRSSLGRVRFPLPAGTGTHRHVHSWQASPKTCEKPGDSWMLLSQAAFKKRKKEKRERKHLFMFSKPRTFRVTLKSLFNTLPKTLFTSSVCDTSHIWLKKGSHIFSVSTFCYTICALSIFSVCCTVKGHNYFWKANIHAAHKQKWRLKLLLSLKVAPSGSIGFSSKL